MPTEINWATNRNIEDLKKLESVKQLESAIIYGLPIDIYHHDEAPGVSASTIVGIKKSYAHYQEEKLKPKGPGLVFGNAVHAAILEPETFHDLYAKDIDRPKFDKRTKIGKLEYAEWVEKYLLPFEGQINGKEVLSQTDFERLKQIQNSLSTHKLFMNLLIASQKEVTFFARCESTGVLRKCRTDMINVGTGVTCDLKTTIDASYLGFPKQVVNYLYHVKQAYYHDVLKSIFNKNFTCLFMAVENVAPFDCQMFELLESHIETGQQIYKRKLEYLSRVINKEIEPGYSKDIQPLAMPAYSFDVDSF